MLTILNLKSGGLTKLFCGLIGDHARTGVGKHDLVKRAKSRITVRFQISDLDSSEGSPANMDTFLIDLV